MNCVHSASNERASQVRAGIELEAPGREPNPDTLEPVGDSFVTDDSREREDDIIGRVRRGQQWLYGFLLIECQSRVDPFMALRITNYPTLLYQDLIEQPPLDPIGKLPSGPPIGLCNGETRWRAA